jgi:ABC-type glycerol-3-phosphate transport system permease component
MRRRNLGIVTVRQAVMVAMAIVSLYPLWFLVQTALKTNEDYTLSPTGFPTSPTLHNLKTVIVDLPVPRWALNSAIVTIASVGISTIIALFAAYAIVFSSMRLRELLLRTNLALMVIPPVALLIPMFIFMVDVHLINSLTSVIIFYSGLMLPFSVFFFVNFFRQFPMELIEAATVDGAKPWTTLRRIVLPISAAATFTLVIVNAIWVWNELLIALVFLQDENRRTLMAGLTLFQGRYATNEPLVLAGAFISILPVILVYLAGQRFFVRGLTAGIGK